jgi:hypothetical protein
MLDDAEKQSIREWFRGLVRSRSGGEPDRSRDEHTRLTHDLDLPEDTAADVRGGSEGASPAEPSEPT